MLKSRNKTIVTHSQHGAAPAADAASSRETATAQSSLRIDNLTKPSSRPPLGLPNGSVRALLTILIVAVVIAQVARGQLVSTLWTETLMIAPAHYFSTRRFIKLPPELIHQLEAAGAVETELHPLYLPNRSIRIMIFAAFGGLAVYLYAQGRLFDSGALSILGVVFAYFFGTIARMATSLVDQRQANPRRPRLARYQGDCGHRRAGLHRGLVPAPPRPSAPERVAKHDTRHGAVLLRFSIKPGCQRFILLLSILLLIVFLILVFILLLLPRWQPTLAWFDRVRAGVGVRLGR